jgi:hypothetical protein
LEFNKIIFNPTESRFEIQLFNKLPRYLNSKLNKIDFILIDSTLDNTLPVVSGFVDIYTYSIIPQIPDYYKNYSFVCEQNNDLEIESIFSDFIITYYKYYEIVESCYLHFVLLLFQEKLNENCESVINTTWKKNLVNIINESVYFVYNNNIIASWSDTLGGSDNTILSREKSIFYSLTPFALLKYTNQTEAKFNNKKWNTFICSSISDYITDPGLSAAVKNIINPK